MKIYPRIESETRLTLERLKDCSEYKRVSKERLEIISFLEEFQKTVTYSEAILLNNLRRMPTDLYIEAMQIFRGVIKIYNQKNSFYKSLKNLPENFELLE